MLQDPSNTTVGAGSIAGWRTNPDAAAPEVVPDATLALIAPPSAGEVDVESDPFTVSADGDTQGDVIVTPTIASAPPGGSGTFSPTSLTINSVSNPADSFTFTPDAEGDYSIGISNDAGLSNPDPTPYQSQNPYVAPDLESCWICDLHPKRPMGASQGVVPSGSVDHDGESNAFNVQTQVAGTNVAAASIATSGSTAAGTIDADSVTRNAYEWLQIITDPDNASRSAYVFRLDKTATNWEANKGKAIRSQLSMAGNPRRLRPWGAPTWFCTAVRIPAAMKTITNPGFILLAEHHTTPPNDLGTGGDHVAVYFNPGGAIPENSSLKVTTSTWNWTTYPATGGGEGTKTTKSLFSGGSNPANQVPEDEWIFIALKYSLWHGYDDPSSSPVDTPAGPFYVEPYVAVADGDVVAKAQLTGTWGYPYAANNAGWDYPVYPVIALYTNPKSGSNWTEMEVMNLGMMEWLVSDIEAANPGRTVTAHDIIAAFKASRLVTPP